VPTWKESLTFRASTVICGVVVKKQLSTSCKATQIGTTSTHVFIKPQLEELGDLQVGMRDVHKHGGVQAVLQVEMQNVLQTLFTSSSPKH
jgi:hypothetical protein